MQAVEHFITQFVPEHYDLFLDLSRETKTFSGKVTITGQAKTDRISLHQKRFGNRFCRSCGSSSSVYS